MSSSQKENQDVEKPAPHNHPIVNRPKRPEWLFDDTHPTKMDWPSRRRQARRYIEHLEKEKDRLEAAIRQKDNALEVCQDRRWEAEEKVGELMEEVERLKPLAARAPMFTRDEDEDFS